jgi:predicted transcriptional regulator
MIHAVVGSHGSKQWACGVFKTRRSALAYLRKAPRRERSKLFVLSMQDLNLPIYIIQSPCGLLFAPWSKAQRYVKPGITIFQAIYSFRSDKPHIDDMRQLLGLADIDSSNFKEVPDLMRLWKEQEEGWAWLDRNLDKEQRRRFEARKRKAIRSGLQRMREGKVFTHEEAEAALVTALTRRLKMPSSSPLSRKVWPTSRAVTRASRTRSQ